MLRATAVVLVLMGCGPRPLPHEGKSVAQLRRMLDDAVPVVQAQAALGLSLHGPEAVAALPRLVERLKGPNVLVRQQSALALGKIGPKGGEAVGPLAEALADRAWEVRRQAALALGEIGEPALAALPALEKLGKGEHLQVRRAAQQALDRLRAYRDAAR